MRLEIKEGEVQTKKTRIDELDKKVKELEEKLATNVDVGKLG